MKSGLVGCAALVDKTLGSTEKVTHMTDCRTKISLLSLRGAYLWRGSYFAYIFNSNKLWARLLFCDRNIFITRVFTEIAGGALFIDNITNLGTRCNR